MLRYLNYKEVNLQLKTRKENKSKAAFTLGVGPTHSWGTNVNTPFFKYSRPNSSAGY